ncbi:hypothetical protein AB4Z19_15515 [Pseudoduganella sp. RAF19]|uniref:hypothetical protein n=1 Tax=Bacteria TaxID=2 RepID=UPI003F97EAD0
MTTTMRAKLQVGFVQVHTQRINAEGKYDPNAEPTKSMETLQMNAVCAKSYPADGSDEDNTYAKWSPGANLSINIANPELWDKFKVGDKFYVDFTPAD